MSPVRLQSPQVASPQPLWWRAAGRVQAGASPGPALSLLAPLLSREGGGVLTCWVGRWVGLLVGLAAYWNLLCVKQVQATACKQVGQPSSSDSPWSLQWANPFSHGAVEVLVFGDSVRWWLGCLLWVWHTAPCA